MIKQHIHFPRIQSFFLPILLFGIGCFLISCNTLVQPINNPVVNDVTPTITSNPTVPVVATPTLTATTTLLSFVF
ncbi:MAG: hypothetical protein ACPL4H_07430, partial [Anaerolineales bacterium]